MNETARPEPGSFRDRNGRIYYDGDSVYRGIGAGALSDWQKLSSTSLYRESVDQGKLIATHDVPPGDVPDAIASGNWAAVLRHQRIPFVSYPYEWSFSMLKDAALLQLEMIDRALDEDMAMKDASSFNVQWLGAQPVFIDIGSFERLVPGTPWVGYRQFCTMFLYPLMLQAYKDVPFHPWFRGSIEGMDPEDIRNIFSLRDCMRPGVLVDVVLQAGMQRKYAHTDRQVKQELRGIGFRKEMIKSNLRRLTRLVSRMSWKRGASVWSDYADQTSYTDADTEAKVRFVREVVASRERRLVWDLGANTGRYSRIAAENSGYVVAMDSDHLAVERLYAGLRRGGEKKILPLVMDLANASPNLGWRGLERKGLSERGKPDLILALALIHHIVISANIPLKEFVEWLATLGGDLIIEFVTKEDPMVKTLLRNKEDQYHDYDQASFENLLSSKFTILKQHRLASNTRQLYFAEARPQ